MISPGSGAKPEHEQKARNADGRNRAGGAGAAGRWLLRLPGLRADGLRFRASRTGGRSAQSRGVRGVAGNGGALRNRKQGAQGRLELRRRERKRAVRRDGANGFGQRRLYRKHEIRFASKRTADSGRSIVQGRMESIFLRSLRNGGSWPGGGRARRLQRGDIRSIATDCFEPGRIGRKISHAPPRAGRSICAWRIGGLRKGGRGVSRRAG
ncbi:MAG: hypothetical protein BWZ10_02989 [candidate division BRC1 bacterium ADurb.BinA364]|nr:MAG: hypothetical protein BWZ10_02989 [candidate division BRC1 bacterium ADurb.BinA364]